MKRHSRLVTLSYMVTTNKVAYLTGNQLQQYIIGNFFKQKEIRITILSVDS